MVEVLGPDRVRVEVDAAQVRHPGQGRRVAGDHLLGGAPGREAEQHGLDPFRPLVRGALLEERLALGTVHEPLEHVGPPGRAAQRAVGHGQVIPDQVELGVPGMREIHLARVRYLDGLAPDVQALLPIRHDATVTGRVPAGHPRDMRYDAPGGPPPAAQAWPGDHPGRACYGRRSSTSETRSVRVERSTGSRDIRITRSTSGTVRSMRK